MHTQVTDNDTSLDVLLTSYPLLPLEQELSLEPRLDIYNAS